MIDEVKFITKGLRKINYLHRLNGNRYIYMNEQTDRHKCVNGAISLKRVLTYYNYVNMVVIFYKSIFSGNFNYTFIFLIGCFKYVVQLKLFNNIKYYNGCFI